MEFADEHDTYYTFVSFALGPLAHSCLAQKPRSRINVKFARQPVKPTLVR